jgi:AcrR family transcriptional regulator
MQERSTITRTHLLETANRFFSHNGYEATAVADICLAAGVSKGAFYHHFPSKQALFVAILEQWLAGLDLAFEMARQQSANVPDAILHMAELAGQVFQSADDYPSILLQFWTQALRDHDIWQATVAPYRRYEQYFTQLIESGIAEGSFQADVDPNLVARSLVGLALGLLMQSLFTPVAIDWSKEVRDRVAFFLQGFSRRAA